MKSKIFPLGSAFALGLGAMLLGAPAAGADLAFTWSGDCVIGCPAGQQVTAELALDPDYVFGTPIANDNFGELIFRSSSLNQIITTLDAPTTGLNTGGTLAGTAIAFQNGQKLFSFQVLSGGGLNWTAAAPGGVLFRGLGASKFTPAGVLTVPEPSTWAMMLLGFVGLGFAGYRSTRKGAAVGPRA